MKRYGRTYSEVCDYIDWVDGSDMCVTIEGEEPKTFNDGNGTYGNHSYNYLFDLVNRVNCVLKEMNLYLCNVQISQNKSDLYGDAYKVKIIKRLQSYEGQPKQLKRTKK